MKARSVVMAGLLIGVLLFAAPGICAATETWTLSLNVTGGNLSWVSGSLVGSFAFSEIVGYDSSSNITKTYATNGTLTFTLSTHDNINSTGRQTVFDAGTITLRGSGGTTLISGSLGTDETLTAYTNWNKWATGYKSTNSLSGVFSSSTVSSLIAAYFNIGPEASTNLYLTPWTVFGVASNMRKELLVGSGLTGDANAEVTPVPLPSALLLFAPALLGLVGMRKRLRKNKKNRDSRQSE